MPEQISHPGGVHTVANNAKPYVLVDTETQIPIQTCQIPDSWTATGSTKWNVADANNTFSWSVTFHDLQSGATGRLCSVDTSNSMGFTMERIPLLADNNVLAQSVFTNLLRPIGGPHNYTLHQAGFHPGKLREAQACLQQMLQIAPNVGRSLHYDYTAIWSYSVPTGSHGQNATWVAKFWSPVLAVETLGPMMPAVIVQLFRPILFVAPRATIDDFQRQLLQAIASTQRNPQWDSFFQSTICQLTQARINQANRQAMLNRQLQQMRQRSMDNIRRSSFHVSSPSYASSVNDRVTENFSNYILDREEVSDPFDQSRSITISDNYSHAWLNSSNEVIYSEDSTFNPNTSSVFNNVEWRQAK